jgi:pimeloyl-ACP methyl ester carboxylesterase
VIAALRRAGALLLAAACAAGAVHAQGVSDAAREKRWAEQYLPNLVVGEAVRLRTENGAEFLALYAAPERARAGVLLAHGPGLHPDHGITGELRVHLTERGYSTLSLQMPVLAAEVDDGAAYAKLFPEAAQRVAAGLRFLQEKNVARIAIVSHAMGSAMAYAYLRRTRGAPVAAWASLSFYGVFEEIPGAGIPVLDLYGAGDYRGIRGPASERARILAALPGSRQFAVPEGGRFLAGGEKTVLAEVSAFLDRVLK